MVGVGNGGEESGVGSCGDLGGLKNDEIVVCFFVSCEIMMSDMSSFETVMSSLKSTRTGD
jgi:hypothetical protein